MDIQYIYFMRYTVWLTFLVGIALITIGFKNAASASAQIPLQMTSGSALTASTTPQSPQQAEAPASVGAVVAQQEEPAPAPSGAVASQTPARLIIPKISLDDAIVPLGLDAQGNMAVPPGSTSNVGWYKNGTPPGSEGSAVLDAHVFAAFKNLSKLSVGDDLYVKEAGGGELHFKVESTQTYALADVPAETLFNRTGGKFLNLITCAGTYIPNQGTYDHRLVVYANLVS